VKVIGERGLWVRLYGFEQVGGLKSIWVLLWRGLQGGEGAENFRRKCKRFERSAGEASFLMWGFLGLFTEGGGRYV
jgi:hypothetical protein